MDTFDTSEEVMSEIDIEATEVDFGENFEHGVNDKERENNNEQEAGIDGEKGEKNIEDEKLEEKEETLSQFISANRRGGGEEFKLEYEGTFVLSTLNEEQKTAQADLLTTLTANPEQSIMLPDYVEGKTTYFTASRMDSEGNLKYEIRSFTEKEEEREEKPIDKIDGVKVEEATLNLELNIDIDKQETIGTEAILEVSLLAETEAISEQTIEGVEATIQVPAEEHILIEPEVNDAEAGQEQLIAQEASNINIVESVVVAHEEAVRGDTIRVAEQSTTRVETKTNEQPPVATPTLEDRIRELLKDEDEPTEIVSEQIQTSEVENIQQEQITVDFNRTIEINTTTESVNEAEITLPSTYAEATELSVDKTPDTIIEIAAITNERVEHVIVKIEDIENQIEIHETMQTSHAESIQVQSTEKVEQIFTTDSIEAHKAEEKPEEVVLADEKDIKLSDTREKANKREEIVATKQEVSDKIQVTNSKTEREVKDNVLPFKTTESKVGSKDVEVKNTKPVVEKTNITRGVSKLPNTNREKAVANNQQEKTPENSRKAIILSINKNEVNNTTRNESPISLEKPREKKRTTEETLKARPLDGHEILLQILGISQNATELRNAEPTNSRSVPNINQEEPEIKSTKSIPSIYQQRNLNGITLKIAT
ncbi:hypothetical protein A2814_02730 [Candidatus Nomurabacteria bacterium RIFCSPHIGHO2_01_FULL_38_19]|uniref:Uncharacterized protein n=1 Tax=Candidatus Nomurabacteria bacterium RIFCSPHIGHO2_01_FULL_38_19 TaxID=1801732 RepID=A0A1F6US92_9BACT|nr:MAG: hypothetical protein A2814_02730 [Candidatus Nomurabacteria bacterium RIFCSPHIGHO2_01_FULL_38_19]